MVALLLAYATAASQVAPSMLLNQLVAHFEGSISLDTASLWVLVSMMLVLPILGGVAAAHSGALLARVGTHLKTALTGAIYRKALVFRNDGRFSSGEVQNLMSIDAQQLLRFALFAPLVASAPVQIVACLYLITLQVGQSAWAGIGFLILLVPINVVIFSFSKRLRTALLRQTDARVKLMTEILQGIRIIKFFAWEGPMVSKVSRIRARELVVVKKVSYVLAIGFSLVLLSAPVLLPIIVFADYTARGNELTASTAFTTIALFGAVRFSFAFLPMVLLSWAQAAISIGRIGRFLLAPEITLPPLSDRDDAPIVLKGATFRWPSGADADAAEAASAAPAKRGCCGRGKPAAAGGGKPKGGKPAAKGGGGGKPKGKPRATEAEVAEALRAADVEVKGGGCCGEAQFLALSEGAEPLSSDSWGASAIGADASGAAASAAVKPAAKPAAKSGAGEVASPEAVTVDAGETPAAAAAAESSPEDSARREAAAASAAERRDRPQVREASIEVRKGELLAIVGRVGSGKSTLLQGMMGEVPIEGGEVFRAGKVAYVPQAAWITNETVRDNILCGEPCDETRLSEAMRVSQLLPDLEQLPRGELTLIGERGVSLSGGQKQRVSLARATYAGMPVVLMDDPLSAVDAHVGEAIFAELVTGAIKSTTRVLVTNALQFLPRCDRVAVMEDGAIVEIGSFEDVRRSEAYGRASADIEEAARRRRQSSVDGDESAAAATNALRAVAAAAAAGAEDEEEAGLTAAGGGAPSGEACADPESASGWEPKDGAAASAASTPAPAAKDPTDAASQEDGKSAAGGSPAAAGEDLGDAKAGTRTIEARETGNVDAAAYWYYLAAGGGFGSAMVILAQLLGRAAELGGAFWVSYWAEEIRANPGTDSVFFLNMYALIGCVGVLFITVRACFIAECRVRASFLLHERLLRHIIRAPAAWFDDTPVGRILNRFAGDMEKIDEQLPPTLTQLLGTGVSVLGAIIAIAISSNGTLVIALIPLLWFYYRVQNWFRRSSTELQRVESITRSPIFVSFDSTLDGLSSIRAYDRQAAFTRRNDAAVNANSVPYLLLNIASQWLAMRLDSIGALLAFGVAAVAAGTTGFIPAGWVGIGLSTALEMTAFLKHGVRMLAQTETMMNAVERTQEFSSQTPVEAKLVYTKADLAKMPDAVEPEPSWPSAGALAFEGVRMRYGLAGRQGPEVLKGVTFSVPARAKVGIVGRTGSGKSSCSMALFRLVEASGGRIMLDGQDIAKLSLGRLRSSMAIVPQDPVLFSPDIRTNLDPFRRHSDAALRSALAMVELEGKLELDDDVKEGGANLSQGTRQLICIARAILRRPRVLIMDEATASVDERTDDVVQRAMREAFKDATVLVIAHRLRTIADSDYVLVLDKGVVAEFDEPHTLLSDKEAYPESGFRALVAQTREQAPEIHRIAEAAFNAKHE